VTRNRISHKAKADTQQKLSQALMSFLHVSQTGLSFKSWMPNEKLAANALINLDSAFQASSLSLLLSSETASPKTITVASYAKILTDAYRIWEKNVCEDGLEEKDLPLGRSFLEWQRESKIRERYWPIHELYKLLQNDGNKFFSRALIHGSIATLDDTPGFSDMDLAFVVHASVLKNPEKLLKLRQLAREILTLTYAFDPLMHHGPYYISELDLNWYPEAMFPAVLFANGVELIAPSSPLRIFVRPSNDITNQMLDLFENFFTRWSQRPCVLKDSYELEWILGSALFVPALYLQQKTGVFRYKRAVFPLAEQDFSGDEWEPVRIASELRKSLDDRPRPSHILVWCARRLKIPGLLQTLAKRHPRSRKRAAAASKVIGRDYPQKVLQLLKSMKRKLGNNLVTADDLYSLDHTRGAI